MARYFGKSNQDKFGSLVEDVRAWQEVRDEITALVHLLLDKRIIGLDAYRARLHKQKFNTAKRLHPISVNTSFVDALVTGDVSFAAAPFLGKRACACVKASSRSIANSMLNAMQGIDALEQHLYVCGGANSEDEWTFSVERFKPILGTWEEVKLVRLPWRPPARNQCLKEGAYFCGQVLADSNASHKIGWFNPALHSWETISPGLARRCSAASSAILGGCLYVCGGQNEEGQSSNIAQRYDPKDGTWEDLPCMNCARRYAAVAVLGRRLYMIGGNCGGELPGCRNEYYDPKTSEWVDIAITAHQRFAAAAAALSGKIYVCGGLWSPWEVERFDPAHGAQGAWEVLPNMPHARSYSDAVSFSSKVFLIGGNFADDGGRFSEAIPHVDCFNPESGEWEIVSQLSQNRYGGKAMVLTWQL